MKAPIESLLSQALAALPEDLLPERVIGCRVQARIVTGRIDRRHHREQGRAAVQLARISLGGGCEQQKKGCSQNGGKAGGNQKIASA